MSYLEAKKAIVTGASRGLGRGIALRLAKEGADVACVARTAENAQGTVDEIKAMGRNAFAYGVDVADEAAVTAAVAGIAGDLGGVDILVNNAGINRDGLLARMSTEDWDAVVDTNLKGAFLWSKPVTRIMAKQRSGRIINMSSVIGLMGNAGQANYAASKAGLIGFTKSLAREFASRGITVNVICPGFIETDMTAALNEKQREDILSSVPLGRMGQVEDVAGLVAYLAGPDASYMTAQVLTVDGGMVH
ncbi:MAG: 3-oxoacyl-[acyl-carrier-protein] reductase [Verrucomicrobiota bacterium]